MKQEQRFFFCPMCGHKLSYEDDGEKMRLTCPGCGYVLYENPAVGVAAVLLDSYNRILLGRRNRGRRKGMWCIPCGYVDYEEDIYSAVVRELKEETGLDIAVNKVFNVYTNFVPDKNTVGIWFLAEHKGGDLKAGDDLDKVDFFNLDSLPSMAFDNDKKIIQELKMRIEDKE